MAEKILNRVIICVDGSEYDENGTLANSQGFGNTSNVFKLRSLVATNISYDGVSRGINQTVRYYQAGSDGRSVFRSRASASLDQQVKDITKDVCNKLESPQDEVFFYGFGRGAYIVRAVACVLHYMGLPKLTGNFDDAYQKALDLEKAHSLDDSLNGTKLLSQLRVLCTDAPIIQFVGTFDTVKPSLEKHQYDISYVKSIRNVRHALAFNETRVAPEIFHRPESDSMEGRSFVQAWFMGTNQDMGGGMQQDGLSLYPFQWMVVESIKAGLVVQPDTKHKFLELAFPQFLGGAPKLNEAEKSQWRLRYANGIESIMYDLQTLHSDRKNDSTHSIKHAKESKVFNTQRKIWNNTSKALLGWTDKGPWGNVIHHSMYTILDRNPKLYDQGLFKLRKKELADFQERCLDDQGQMQPWLDGLQLQASGVKAFRILVCGKTGVGKSTLINKVFGVEMTEESTSYAQGAHDINTAFESPNHPGLLIHDSRGWQAGSDQELDLIAKFLRHRAFQKDPAESLHVIWFCVDSDVSRIEEADKRTFETIAQFSNHVPVFVVGTKKDKLVAYRKMELLEEYMKRTNDYKEASSLANAEANKAADDQFLELKEQLSRIEHYKADGYCCISKDDDTGVRTLLNQTLDLIADDRVRIFCVAAQVMDVEQKIDSAITECMRLGTHAIRTAMVPLPFTGIIGTPTVSRIICEHVLQNFGFPKATPEAVDEIMSRVVMGNLKSFMKTSLVQFGAVSAVAVGVGVPTLGIGTIVGGAGAILAAPPTARMLFKCACDMILILERSFRYQGRYVSVKQIEDAAVYYTTATTKTFSGKEVLLQQHVHDEVDRLIPLKKVSVGFRFARLRSGLQDIIYMNRFEQKVGAPLSSVPSSEISTANGGIPELDSKMSAVELDAASPAVTSPPPIPELPGDTKNPVEMESPETPAPAYNTLSPLDGSGTGSGSSEFTMTNLSSIDSVSSPTIADDMSTSQTLISPDYDHETARPKRTKSEESGSLFKRSLSKWSLRKAKTNV
ncbi:uncharacterized protein HMPREF1541_06833 [Cyphellophora europaea CBS 101466]|uniref:DUF2235 domain-containing protein n=1 Tax=Cyphellophora europaea (strain CBS 101466) TaxID=1220924 RepID=W2RSU3_CYPE1|nr:uncharacterized protein HMPREF1541_06833 [Cyphellophora europaea CBS 101466]ETN38794.1 hypothetical protein HMPREF1541_06833 [Cyphellophora europaea CBS 101466]